jgi:hypothetical protein
MSGHTQSPKKQLFTAVPGAVGSIGGWLLSQYTGPALWIPGIAGLVLFFVFAKTRFRPRHYWGAIIFAGSHAVWFLLAGAVSGAWSAVGLDIILISVAVLWLWIRPGMLSASFLFLLELVSLVANVRSIATVEFGSDAHRSLTVHCLLRVFVLIALPVGLWQTRRAPSDANISTSPGAA